VTNVLVTGGAGYIGSHACKALKAAGYTPITYDNLCTGWEEAVKFGPFEKGDLRDKARLDQVFAAYQPAAVMHFAALSQVGESMRDPGPYWDNNVAGSVTLMQAAVEAGCLDFVFSSTCATYGDQDNVVLDEESPQFPINAYGASKRAIEDMLRDFEAAYGLRHVIFRYFNVAGADPAGEVGEFHQPETHLIPLMLDAIDGKRNALTIFGTDYDTPDGTCIRDYVHVCDLVDAHVLGLKWLEDEKPSRIFNLGTGTGLFRARGDRPFGCCHQPRCAHGRGGAAPGGLHQAGLWIDPRAAGAWLDAEAVHAGTDDFRRVALAPNWTLRQITPILISEIEGQSGVRR
jgi:UDP-glucose 4-epimerase